VQGQRLAGLAELLGGYIETGRWLDDPFVRALFLEGAGRSRERPDALAQAVKPHLERVAETAGAASGGGVAPDLYEAARALAASLLKVEPAEKRFSRPQLQTLFSKATTNAKGGELSLLRSFAEAEEFCLEPLVHGGALHQGVEVPCPACGIKSWYHADAIAQELKCPGCTSPVRLPLMPQWTLRLSTLVETAIARDAMVPLVEAIHRIGVQTQEMVVVIPSQDLRADHHGDKLTDLDLICLRDGRFVVGEVKSSVYGVDEGSLATLLAVARAIRPNEVIVAAKGEAWPAAVQERLERLNADLTALEVTLSPLLLTW